MFLDPAGDKTSLLITVISLVIKDPVAVWVCRPELLFLLMYVVLDDRIGRVEYRLRRAVILLQQDHLCLREMLLKLEDVANIRLSEPVNALRVVADHADILLFLGQVVYQRELQRVGVLIFVNQYVFVAVVVFFAGLRRFAKQLNSLDQQIVKIESVCGIEPLVIHLENLGNRRTFLVTILDL